MKILLQKDKVYILVFETVKIRYAITYDITVIYRNIGEIIEGNWVFGNYRRWGQFSSIFKTKFPQYSIGLDNIMQLKIFVNFSKFYWQAQNTKDKSGDLKRGLFGENNILFILKVN